MNWILIGTLAGSLITSTHDTREQCEGRAVMLRENKAAIKCVEMPPAISGLGCISTITGKSTNCH